MDGQNRIFVGGIPVRVEKKAIIEFFSQFGKIKYCKVKKNSKTGRSLGYAYLTFEDEATLRDLVDRQIEFCGRICECKQVFKKTELKEELAREKRRKLLVYDIDPNITNTDLKSYFESLTCISHAYVVKDPESMLNKGYGYVVFNTEEEVDNFVKRGLDLSIQGKPFNYSNEIHMPPKKKDASVKAVSPTNEVNIIKTTKKMSENKLLVKKDSREKRGQSASPHENIDEQNDSSSSQLISHDQISPSFHRKSRIISTMEENYLNNAINGKTASSNGGRLKSRPQGTSLSGKLSPRPLDGCTGGTKTTRGSKIIKPVVNAGKNKHIPCKRSLWTQITKISSQIDQRDENYRFNRCNHTIYAPKRNIARRAMQFTQF